ncbi:MAG: hypothetical protein RIF39_17455 [Cyclobacteriaceae bacterium]
MSNQIDNLFKKKLEAHSVEPSKGAWVKISSSASKKNKAVIWFRAAAALLLMTSALWLYNNTNDTTSSEIAEVTTEETGTKELSTNEPVAIQKEEDRALSAEKNKTSQPSPPSVQKTNVPLVAQNNEKLKNESTTPLKVDLISEPLESIALVDSNPFQDALAVEASITESTSKPIVIEYELKSYAKTPEPEMEPLFQKKNGLKKVLDVANNLRTGESSLSGLRQAKEDLFALNFKKEDKKNNR